MVREALYKGSPFTTRSTESVYSDDHVKTVIEAGGAQDVNRLRDFRMNLRRGRTGKAPAR